MAPFCIGAAGRRLVSRLKINGTNKNDGFFRLARREEAA